MRPRDALIKAALCLTVLFGGMNAWATDIQCQSTQQSGQRIICDYAILSHEYDDIYAQQQSLLQQGKLGQNVLSAWQAKRDACHDVSCMDHVFAAWGDIDKSLTSAGVAAAATAAVPVMTASQALGPAPGSPGAASDAAAASATTDQQAALDQQASGVAVSKQGSAYGVALPQAVASQPDAAVPALQSSAAATSSATTAAGISLLSLALLIIVAALVAGGVWIYRRRRVA